MIIIHVIHVLLANVSAWNWRLYLDNSNQNGYNLFILVQYCL